MSPVLSTICAAVQVLTTDPALPRLTLAQFGVLLNVAAGGDLRRTAIGDRLGMTNPGVTRALDRLAEAGLIARTQVPEDHRLIEPSLTVSGQDLLDRIARAAEVPDGR